MSESDAISFGEKILAMLDQGSFTATYKYAVLLALVDACLEETDQQGRPPAAIHPRVLAARVIELYWPHTSLYGDAHGAEAVVLRQNSGGQAEIVSRIRRFRASADPGAHVPLARARAFDPAGYDRLIGDVTWKLVEMPLPRLQRFGKTHEPFLFLLDWDERVSRRAYERGDVDQVLRLRPGVGEHLVRLAGLLRPLVQQQWAARVVQFNRAQVPALDEQGDLEQFLFGAQRIDLSPVRSDLTELQSGDCFYCNEPLRARVDIDHFLPWARHPDNGIFNLVATHPTCNNRKREFLAAAVHVAVWSERFKRSDTSQTLEQIAVMRRWTSQASRTLSVARAVYLRLPPEARLWVLGEEFTSPQQDLLVAALGSHTFGRQAAEDPTPFSRGHKG